MALALVAWVVEAQIPVPLPVPGAKLGLANIIVLTAVVRLGLADALLVNVLRVVLGSLVTGTFGNPSFFMALAGGTASALVMGLMWTSLERRVSLVGVSLAGAFVHNAAQVAAAVVLVGHPAVLAYLPYLLLFSLPTGLLVGIAVYSLDRALPGPGRGGAALGAPAR